MYPAEYCIAGRSTTDTMSSGIGRGRGWLNINKNQNVRPGLAPSPPASSAAPVSSYSDAGTGNTEVGTGKKDNSKYSSLVSLVSMFDENDDGILLNQKLKHIIEEFNKICNCSTDVE